MLKIFSNSRTSQDNINLGVMTGLSAGMVNVASLVLFFTFTSNITGHYAILAEEISSGKWFQVIVVLSWIVIYFMGSFISNYVIIHGKKTNRLLLHSIPLILEIICLSFVAYYGVYHYSESLVETEFMVAFLLFTMGLQNGLTATISNFAVKTTHLTGLTTDLAIHLSMITSQQFRHNNIVTSKIKLYLCILFSYMMGGIIAGVITHYFQFKVFLLIAGFMSTIILYDYLHMKNGQYKIFVKRSNKRLAEKLVKEAMTTHN